MKNKNQKKLKNKKYRWGAYGRTTVGGRGCAPSFSALYSVSAGPEMLNFSCFSESVRKSLYFCNRKRNRKVFERTLTHCKRHTQAKSIAQGRIYNIIYANLSPVCECSKHVSFAVWLWKGNTTNHGANSAVFHVKHCMIS